jgi:hypothetical protein
VNAATAETVAKDQAHVMHQIDGATIAMIGNSITAQGEHWSKRPGVPSPISRWPAVRPTASWNWNNRYRLR